MTPSKAHVWGLATLTALVVACSSATAGSPPQFTFSPDLGVAGGFVGFGAQMNQHLYADLGGPAPNTLDLEQKVRALQPQIVRVFFNSTAWSYPDRMASFVRTVQLAQRTDAQINVTWQGGSYASTRSYLARFAGVLADLLQQGGIGALWVTLQNEPNTTKITLPQYEDLYRVLDRELRDRDVRQRVHFMAGDLVATSQAEWFRYLAAHMGDLVDAWSVHVYWNFWDAGKIDRRLLDEVHEVDTAVEIGGAVASRQGLNVPGSTRGLDAVPEEDLDMLKFGESIGVDLVALSFVRTAEDVTSVRRHTRLPLIAKIEKPQAVDAAEEIIRAADCVMVARGDLGIELPIAEVPMVQKHLLHVAGRLARPSITATQMLDSMVSSPRPTRAEVADVANAIIDGTDAVMLSQETAIGNYPVEAVAMMASIAERTEHGLPYRSWNEERVRRDARDPAYTVAYSACAASRDLHLAALVVPTLSGRSARLISAHRPQVPIYALSPGKETVRRCALMWGVQAASMRRHEVTEALIADAARRVVELGWVKSGARVGITAGLPSGRPGTTSLMQIQRV